jgi:SAM-dependent methyltransferase
MSERSCPACGAGERDERGLKNGLRVGACRGCGTLYARGGAGGEADAACDYDAYYHEANLSVPSFIERRLDEIVGGFAPFRRTGRLLDIGCGAGTLLHAARRAGWDAAGTEVSRPAVEHVRGEGFEVFAGELQQARFPDGHFDVVTASEILEHLPDPRVLLAEAARILRPGGLFWGTTPHGRGLSARALGIEWSTVSPPEHLQLFSLGGMRRLLKSAGFTRARVITQGFNHYEVRHALLDKRRSRGDDKGATANGANTNGDATVSDDDGSGTTTVKRGEGAAVKHEEGAAFDRVQSAYRLNETLMSSRAGRLTKAALNGVLSAARLGDSIKIWAIR